MNHLKSSNSSHAFLSWSLLLALSLAGMILLFICTSQWGVGASVDSIAYIGGAREIIKGNGYRSQISGSPITQWPPLFSAALALIGFSGIDPLDAARILNGVLFGLNILLAGIILKKYTNSTLTAILGSFFMIASHSMALIHGMAWSEPLFILWSLIIFLCLTQYLETGSKVLLFASAAGAALACLTRYVGISLIATGGIMILFFNSGNWKKRFLDCSLFLAVSFLPLGLWFARNRLSAGNLTHMDHQFHPPTWNFFASLFPTVTAWIFPPLWPEFLKNAVLITVAGLTFAGLIVNRSKKTGGADNSNWLTNPPFRFCLSLVFFGIFYFGMLIFHRTFADVDIKVSLRYMSPLYVTSLLFVLIILQRWLNPYRQHLAVKGLLFCLVTLLGFASVANAYLHYSKLYYKGTQYTSRKWRIAETMTKLKTLPPSPVIYSNAPTPIYFLLGQPVKRLPKKFDDEHVTKIQTDKPTTDYLERLSAMKVKLASKKGYIVLFNSKVSVKQKWFEIPPEELKERLSLAPVAELKDGVIYQVAQT